MAIRKQKGYELEIHHYKLACNINTSVNVGSAGGSKTVVLIDGEEISPEVVRRMVCHMDSKSELGKLFSMDKDEFIKTYHKFTGQIWPSLLDSLIN